MPSHYLPRHPLYQKPLPKQPSENILLGKIAASLKPFPKVGYQPGMDAHAFGRKSGLWVQRLGGLSAAGDWC